jgi:hypothetical protein
MLGNNIAAMKLLAALVLWLFALPSLATNLTLNWTAPTQNTDGSPIAGAITYNVYGGACGAAFTQLQSGITGTTNVRTNVNPGNWGYAVTAVVANQESARTSPVCTTVAAPVPVPGTPGGLTVTLATTSTIAYGLAPAHDRLAFLIVGSVPLGAACLPDQTANLYRVVPVASVTFTAPYKAATVPTVFALCSG